MRPTEGGAGRSTVAVDREAAEEDQRTEIVADRACAGKQGSLGRCPCGVRIGVGVVTLRCQSCAAWARWRRRRVSND